MPHTRLRIIKPDGSLTYQWLHHGRDGNVQTLREMAALVRNDLETDVGLANYANQILNAAKVAGDVRGRSMKEVGAIFYFVRDRFIFRRDPTGGNEFIQDARITIERGFGDCDGVGRHSRFSDARQPHRHWDSADQTDHGASSAERSNAMKLSNEQLQNAATIVRVGREVGANDRQIHAAIATALVESRLKNLNYGDRDSLGLFQQRPSKGWGTKQQIQTPEYAARAFFLGAGTNKGALHVSQAGTIGQLAQRVQRSAFPLRYDQMLTTAQDVLSRVGALAKTAINDTVDIAKKNPGTTGGIVGVVVVALVLGAILRH
jgi:hypothetical protein